MPPDPAERESERARPSGRSTVLPLESPAKMQASQEIAVNEKAQNDLALGQVLEQCKAGSREAFRLLLENYEQRVFNFIFQLTRNSHDAEDLTQETFLKVYQSIQRFDSNQGFTTWLFTIAKRTAYNHFRSARHFEEFSSREEVDPNDPSTLLEQKDERSSLWNVARSLNQDQYEALWLRYGEGFSVAQTAAILNTNQIRVRVLLHRARKNLAQRLRGAGLHPI